MNGEIQIAPSAAKRKGLTTAGDDAATIASLQQQVAYLTGQLEMTTRSSAETQNDNTSGGNRESDNDGTAAMDWEPWMDSFDLDNMDFGLGDHQEHSFINDTPLIEATPDVFSEVPQTWLPSNPDQITQNNLTWEDHMSGLEFNFNFDIPGINGQSNPSTSPEIHQIPIAIFGSNEGSSRDSEVHRVRARRTVLSVAQKAVLENWIFVHANPYPTKQDKEELSQLTGLSIAQISSWFSRTRQRKLKRVSYVDAHSRMAPEEANGHLEAWILPDSLFSKQGSWLNGGSLPSRPNSPVWNQPAPRRSRSLPPRYTLDNIRYYVRNKARVAHNEEISLNVIHSDANEQDSATSQLGARLSFQRLGETPYMQQPDECSKNALIHRWLGETPDAHAEFDASNSERSVDVDQLEALPLPPARTPTPFPPVMVLCEDMPRPDDRPSGDTQDSASVTGSAGPSIASGGSHGSVGSYRSFGSRRGRRIEFHHSQTGRALPWEPSRKRTVTEWEDLSRAKRRAGSVSLGPLVELDASDLFEEEAEEGPKKYSCTFCESSFGRPSSWKRHEESVHAPQKYWICAPLLSSQKNSALQCPICDKAFVTDINEGQGSDLKEIFDLMIGLKKSMQADMT
ncbi:hypothetical protein E0Z10_g7359 [Xylaria hypoxylon]|uniref:Homeobox domain-containing protein n=1 Tax=Xylaria hypoxylon TaxID=37992 RepID=A0A4Z0YBT5_9PEZI|nr:hypothetical protein E0Z10_g7359 [Xylaria hypoxylon]